MEQCSDCGGPTSTCHIAFSQATSPQEYPGSTLTVTECKHGMTVLSSLSHSGGQNQWQDLFHRGSDATLWGSSQNSPYHSHLNPLNWKEMGKGLLKLLPGRVASMCRSVCRLILCQLDPSWSHFERGNLTWQKGPPDWSVSVSGGSFN